MMRLGPGMEGMDATSGRDAQWFEATYLAHEHELRRYVARRVGVDAADDIVAEGLHHALAAPQRRARAGAALALWGGRQPPGTLDAQPGAA